MRAFAVTLALGMVAVIFLAATAEDKNVVREKAPPPTANPDGISDGPDGFPTLKRNPTPPKQRPWRIPPTTPSTTSPDEEEVVIELPPVERIIDMACYSSLTECSSKMSTECSTRYPRPPGTVTATFTRITKYEEGKTCAFVCADRYGELHQLECSPPPPRPTKPPQTTVDLP